MTPRQTKITMVTRTLLFLTGTDLKFFPLVRVVFRVLNIFFVYVLCFILGSCMHRVFRVLIVQVVICRK